MSSERDSVRKKGEGIFKVKGHISFIKRFDILFKDWITKDVIFDVSYCERDSESMRIIFIIKYQVRLIWTTIGT